MDLEEKLASGWEKAFRKYQHECFNLLTLFTTALNDWVNAALAAMPADWRASWDRFVLDWQIQGVELQDAWKEQFKSWLAEHERKAVQARNRNAALSRSAAAERSRGPSNSTRGDLSGAGIQRLQQFQYLTPAGGGGNERAEAIPRIGLNADGSAQAINPAIDPRVIDYLEQGDKGSRVIAGTIQLPGRPTVTGLEALKPTHPREILDALLLNDAQAHTPSWERILTESFAPKRIVENTAVAVSEEFLLHAALRSAYISADAQLGETARKLVEIGLPLEDAAAWRVQATNNLKATIRSRGNAIVELFAKSRANKLNVRTGKITLPDKPTLAELLAKYKGENLSEEKAFERIINRIPSSKVNTVTLSLKVAGTTMLIVEVGTGLYRVSEAPTFGLKWRTFSTEAARIGGGVAGAWAGATIGGKAGMKAGGPWGGAAGGVGGMLVGGVGGSAAAKGAIRVLVYKTFPPDQCDLELIEHD